MLDNPLMYGLLAALAVALLVAAASSISGFSSWRYTPAQFTWYRPGCGFALFAFSYAARASFGRPAAEKQSPINSQVNAASPSKTFFVSSSRA